MVHAEPQAPPLTLWGALSNSLAMTAEGAARGLALEQGCHPTLGELRAALGLDLDLASAWIPLRSIRLPERTPTDDEIHEVMGEMYRGLASTRKVTVRMTGDALEVAGHPAPIPMRAGEPLALWVLVDNTTAGAVELQASIPGAAETCSVGPGRVASFLLIGDPVEAGQTSASLDVQPTGAAPLTHQVALHTGASWELHCDILDLETGLPTATRIYLTDEAGPVAPEGAVLRRDQYGNAFFHAEGEFDARLSGSARLTAHRGMEYQPDTIEFPTPMSGRYDYTLRLERWSKSAAEGWRSGDVHVHLHYGGEYTLDAAHASLVQRAEDVHFMNMMVANSGSGFVNDREFFTGHDHELSDGEHILRWGEEYRNNFYGHLCMFGIEKLVPPIYSGFRLSEYPHDVPANAQAADHCHSVGGTLSYAHPLFGSVDLDRVFNAVRTVEAKELPVDAALGKVDALDVMSYPGVDLEVAELWYRLLNAGIRLPATAGTDTFMNFGGTGIFSNPPAGNRVFAQVEGPFSTEAWCRAVRLGRTFVTNGPMLRMSVNGYPIGARLAARAGEHFMVEAEGISHFPIERLQLIVNGAVVTEAAAQPGGRYASLVQSIQADASCWVAIRALGSDHDLVFGGPLFAHTSPVYIDVGGEPVRDFTSARYFIEWIERLIEMTRINGRFAEDKARDDVIDLFESALTYYEAFA